MLEYISVNKTLGDVSGGCREKEEGAGREGSPGRGGGLLCLEKGTICGLASQELWLSRADMAKIRGAVKS